MQTYCDVVTKFTEESRSQLSMVLSSVIKAIKLLRLFKKCNNLI